MSVPGPSPTQPTSSTRTIVLLSLIPAVVTLVILTIAFRDDDGVGVAAMVLSGAPTLLGFVALSSALPIAVARRRRLQVAVAVVMTAVAGVAAYLVGTTDDAQAGLAILWVPIVALPLAAVLWITQMVVERRVTSAGLADALLVPAQLEPRAAALAIDAVLFGAVAFVPLTWLSHAGFEVVAAVAGVGGAALYLAVAVTLWGRTAGHALLGLSVVDASTGGRVAFGRSLGRALVVAVEVAAVVTVVGVVALLVEAASISSSGRSLTDKLLRTAVLNPAAAPQVRPGPVGTAPR